MGVDGGGVGEGGSGGEGGGEGSGGEGGDGEGGGGGSGGGEGGGGEGGGGEGGGGEGGGGEGCGGNGGCGGCEGGDEGGVQPGANTPYAPHVSGHITAIRSLEATPSGGVNSVPPACANRKSLLICSAQSLAAFSLSDSPEGAKRLRRRAPCSSPLAQSAQLFTSSVEPGEKPELTTVSVQDGSRDEDGGSGKTSRRQELESEQRGKAGDAAAHVPVVASNDSTVPKLLR